MLIDTSAIVAVYRQEKGFQRFLETVAHAKRRWLSVASYLEFIMVTKDREWIDGFLRASRIELIDVSKRDIEEAVEGFFRFGKGVHPVALNFGDCVVYGTAKANSVHLL